MAKIVIDIDDKDYKMFVELMAGNLWCSSNYQNIIGKCLDAIKHGKVLPKGHGNLIESEELLKKKVRFEDFDGDTFDIIHEETIINAPTIIEADKEDE